MRKNAVDPKPVALEAAGWGLRRVDGAPAVELEPGDDEAAVLNVGGRRYSLQSVLGLIADRWNENSGIDPPERGGKWTADLVGARVAAEGPKFLKGSARKLGTSEAALGEFLVLRLANREAFVEGAKRPAAAAEDVQAQAGGAASLRSILPPHLYSEAAQEFDKLIGLPRMKAAIAQIVKSCLGAEAERLLGIKVRAIPRHMVFRGNPGTGKTTVAGLLARIYSEVGQLPKEAPFVPTRASQVLKENAGRSAEAVRALLEKARGGVFFLDEAHALLNGKETGKAVLSEINAFMEENRDDTIIIFGGYSGELDELIKKDKGLKSRFKTFLDFEDFTDEELGQIVVKMANEDGLVLTPEAESAIIELLSSMRAERDFGNGREARNQYESAVDRKRVENADTLRAGLRVSEAEARRITPEHVWGDERPDAARGGKAIEQLIGAEDLEAAMNRFASKVAWYQKRGYKPAEIFAKLNPTFAFLGDPGTGKTTGAKHVGEVLKKLGVLRSDKVIKINVGEIMKEYLGQTAPHMRELLRDSLGKTLLIDEAYALFNPAYGRGNNNPYLDEAMTVLVDFIAENKGKFALVLAGYPGPMRAMLNGANQGLPSRVGHVVEFKRHTVEQSRQILVQMLGFERLELSEGAQAVAHEALRELQAAPGFSNGRDIEKLVEAITDEMALADEMGELDDPDVVTANILQAAVAQLAGQKRVLAGEEEPKAWWAAEAEGEFPAVGEAR